MFHNNHIFEFSSVLDCAFTIHRARAAQFVSVCVFLLSSAITFWALYVYFQFLSKEKETHQEAKCLFQGHPEENSGPCQRLLSFHIPCISLRGEEASDKATLPMLPGETGAALQNVECGNSMETQMPSTSHLTYVICPGTLAVASVWNLGWSKGHKTPAVLSCLSMHYIAFESLTLWVPALGQPHVGNLLLFTGSLRTGSSAQKSDRLWFNAWFCHLTSGLEQIT